jgi:thiamine transporter
VKIETRILTEVVAAVALSGVLHLITLYQFPEGGRITAAAMVPVLFVALRRGGKIGILAGIAYGLVVLVEEPFIYHPVQFLLDYPLAFGALGLAGLFRKLPLVGVAVGIGGRFICHFISGLVFFATYAPAGMDPAVYSAIYNASYLVPELIVSEVVIFILVKRKILQLYM